jgi:GTP cyclohydrolase I
MFWKLLSPNGGGEPKGALAEAIDTYVGALGVGVIVKSRHTCMCYRGIKKNGTMVTSVTLGLMRTDLAARTEFLTLTGD